MCWAGGERERKRNVPSTFSDLDPVQAVLQLSPCPLSPGELVHVLMWPRSYR